MAHYSKNKCTRSDARNFLLIDHFASHVRWNQYYFWEGGDRESKQKREENSPISGEFSLSLARGNCPRPRHAPEKGRSIDGAPGGDQRID